MGGTDTTLTARSMCRIFAKTGTGTRIDVPISGAVTVATWPTQTAAGQADGNGIPLTSSRSNGLLVVSDTGSTNLSGDYYVAAIRGYHIHGTADSNSSQIAVLGAWNNNTATIGSGDKYAVRGHLDLWGITNLTGANVNVGAVSAYVENEAVPVVDSGNVLCGLQAYQVTYKPTVGSGVFPARGINPALWIRASGAAASWQTGVYMPVNSVETGIRIGDWVGSGASGSAIPFATAQNVYADGQLDLVAVFGESTSNLTSAYSAKCGRFRHIATGTSLTVAQETYGLVGQMCAKGATLTHLHAGLMGTFEGTGASVVCNSSYTLGAHAAVIARVGGHTNITATTPLAGFLAFNNGAANLTSGTLSAYAVSVRDTSYKWGYGLYVPGSTVSNGIMLGTSAVPITLGTYANYGFSMYTTCAGTDTGNNLEPFYVKNTLTGAGQVGGRARFHMETNVVLGAWANALKASVDLKTNGHSAGLMSVVCAEMTMPASTPSATGTRAIYEAELVCPASWAGNNVTSAMYVNVTGDTKANFDTYGYLFQLEGVTVASGKMFQANTAGNATHGLRVRIANGEYYLMLTNVAA